MVERREDSTLHQVQGPSLSVCKNKGIKTNIFDDRTEEHDHLLSECRPNEA